MALIRENGEERLRLDKWLWAARFFKTRSLATAAVVGGKVHVNGAHRKPAYALHIGDELRLRKEASECIIVVKGLSHRRGPAKEAILLYEETAASLAAREQLVTAQRMAAMTSPHAGSRPNKRQRRQIIRFIGKGGA